MIVGRDGILVVGDMHVVKSSLSESEGVFDYIHNFVSQQRHAIIVFLGDIFHNNSVLDLPVALSVQRKMSDLSRACRVITIPGNHDGVTPRLSDPNSLQLTCGRTVVPPDPEAWMDSFDFGPNSGVISWMAVPYHHNSRDFEKRVVEASEDCGMESIDFLFCHQTFDGTRYDNGFYAPDGVNVEVLPKKIKRIISGHIHTPSTHGPLMYAGSVRSVSFSEVNHSKFVYWIDAKDLQVTPINIDHLISRNHNIDIAQEVVGSADRAVELISKVGMNPNDRLRVSIRGDKEFVDATRRQLPDTVILVCNIEEPDSLIKADVGESEDTLMSTFYEYIDQTHSPDTSQKAKEVISQWA